LPAKSRGAKQKFQNLRVGGGGPTRDEVQKQKDKHAAGQTVQQIEGGRTKAHREEKQFPFRPQDSKRAGE
jgi:hypothetical protein